MTTPDLCPDCRRPLAKSYSESRDGIHCGSADPNDTSSWVNCVITSREGLRAELADVRDQLAATQRENEAWRALAEWAQAIGRYVSPPAFVRGPEPSWLLVGTDRSLEIAATHAGTGSAPGAAAIDLAVKLGVVK